MHLGRQNWAHKTDDKRESEKACVSVSRRHGAEAYKNWMQVSRNDRV